MARDAPPDVRGTPERALDLLERAFRAAVAAADPETVLPPHLPAAPGGRLLVVGAGKAAAAMAAAVERQFTAGGVRPSGLVITPYGHGPAGGPVEGEAARLGGGQSSGSRIEVVEAGHPLPDAAGMAATRRIVELVSAARPDDLLLVLLSGGGSALLCAPEGVTLAEKVALTRALLASGASIQQINVIRKHLSAVKGGRLAALTRAPSLTLAISDVVGDDPSSIASGPTVADRSTFAEALVLLERFAPEMDGARRALSRGVGGERPETPEPGDPRLARAAFRLVAAARSSLEAAAAELRRAGVNVRLLDAEATGEARELGAAHARLAMEELERVGADGLPVALLSGGEATVTLGPDPTGRGGPNGEYALAFAAAMPTDAPYALLAADSDGIDGGGDGGRGIAGALIGRAAARRLTARHVRDALALHDSHGCLARAGAAFVVGPTRTNVNDVRIVLLGELPG